jgi:hypothetical protein
MHREDKRGVYGPYYENDRVTKTHTLATDEDLARELWDRRKWMRCS